MAREQRAHVSRTSNRESHTYGRCTGQPAEKGKDIKALKRGSTVQRPSGKPSVPVDVLWATKPPNNVSE